MCEMGYRWTSQLSGQYVDGHEREDVVAYRQNVFLPQMAELEARTRTWKNGIDEEQKPWPNDMDDGPHPFQDRTVVWHHDESTFYANDRRQVRWVHRDETTVPHAKGEGASLMVSDFVLADYGWLHVPDHSDEARVLFRAGKGREGYFTNEDILAQARKAMDILESHYPNEKHCFVFDNVTTHLKRADDALSACHMPKNIPKAGKNWGVTVQVIGPDGKLVYGSDGKVLKQAVRMADGQFADGSRQEFYFPPGHSCEGVFKGMAIILEERGFEGCQGRKGKRAECEGFKCAPGTTDCCCRRILFNQPDFVNVGSLLESKCQA